MRGNVLFIEDEEALQMTVGDRLRKEGYSVDYAANGDDGFAKLTGTEPALECVDEYFSDGLRGGLRRCPKRENTQCDNSKSRRKREA